MRGRVFLSALLLTAAQLSPGVAAQTQDECLEGTLWEPYTEVCAEVRDVREQFMRVLDAVSGRPQYAFVRLSGPTDSGTAAKRDLAEFAERIALPIRVFVDNEGEAVFPDQERDHS